MRAASPSDRLVEHALAALKRIADVPAVAQRATAAIEELERGWARETYSVAITGEASERVGLLGQLAGEALFAPGARETARPIVVLRRGQVTTLRALRRDGSVAEHTLERSDPAAEHASVVAAARAAVAAREGALARRERQLTAPGQRPPWWALWRRLVLWIRARAERERRAAEAAQAQLALEQARHQLAAAESDAAHSRETAAAERRAFWLRTHRLTAGADAAVERVIVEVAYSALPEGIDLVDVPAGLDADDIDIQLSVRELRPAEIERLPRRLASQRALRLSRTAADVIVDALAKLDRAVSDKEQSFAARLERLEQRRISDPDAFANAQRLRVRPLVIERVQQLIHQATAELGGQLDELAARWSARVADAATAESLRAALTSIHEEGPAALRAARANAQRLVSAGVRGAAHDFHPQLIAELCRHAPDLAIQAAPAPRAVEIAPRLLEDHVAVELVDAPSRLSSLLRSLSNVRAQMAEKLRDRLARLRATVLAELLDAEPELEGALNESLTTALRTAIDGHMFALSRAIDLEKQTIEGERKQLVPLARALETAREDARKMGELISLTEADARAAPPPIPPASRSRSLAAN